MNVRRLFPDGARKPCSGTEKTAMRIMYAEEEFGGLRTEVGCGETLRVPKVER